MEQGSVLVSSGVYSGHSRKSMGPPARIEWDGGMQGIGVNANERKANRSNGSFFSGLKAPLLIGVSAAFLAGCSATAPEPTQKAKFSPEKYGVKGSPRVVTAGKPVPKGGGRYMVGKPYKIAGKWYHPKHDPDYTSVGYASWYGPTFHGRKTANGEVFDRNALTAAHTTMPLPSYARVTNVQNGRSMIVRVNDRGPFHGNRTIDLSERVATMLDTKSQGIAKVKVEYIGRARLDGEDEKYLMASYVGPGAVTPGGTRPGTQIAQVPPQLLLGGGVPSPRPYPASSTVASYAAPASSYQVAFDPAIAFETASRPVRLASAESGPVGLNPTAFSGAPQQPNTLGVLRVPARSEPADASAVSSYSPAERIGAAHAAFASFEGSGLSMADLAGRSNRR